MVYQLVDNLVLSMVALWDNGKGQMLVVSLADVMVALSVEDSAGSMDSCLVESLVDRSVYPSAALKAATTGFQ